MAGLPLLKLGGLAIKTLAKPVAKRLKIEATKRPTLKNLYVTVGQWTHQASAWITISSAGHKSLGVKELEEAAAFARGADFLSETLVFFVGGAILTFEYTRSNASAAQKEAAKEASRQKFREDLEARFLSLEARVIRMEERQQAGWSSVFPGSKGKEGRRVALEDLPEAPHFADVETLKRKKNSRRRKRWLEEAVGWRRRREEVKEESVGEPKQAQTQRSSPRLSQRQHPGMISHRQKRDCPKREVLWIDRPLPRPKVVQPLSPPLPALPGRRDQLPTGSWEGGREGGREQRRKGKKEGPLHKNRGAGEVGGHGRGASSEEEEIEKEEKEEKEEEEEEEEGEESMEGKEVQRRLELKKAEKT
ncbi:Optic atrophy 3 [Nannochloropsis gaditana]|uniref:Optic atrophy 3 n=1 Tax=Nannochloropsis gaditana TaxID=72520 RepID=W7T967_9STRA|nr:Optic atrophy 3 [Nannochloropsis gaditana]